MSIKRNKVHKLFYREPLYIKHCKMPNDKTQRGYSLPHPDNIAVQDVVRIRNTIEKVDADMSGIENEHDQLKNNFERFSFETFLNLWGKK